MAVRNILRTGEPELLQIAKPVTEFGTPALEALITDLAAVLILKSG